MDPYVEIPDHPQAREEMVVPPNNEVETFAAKCKNLLHSRYKNRLCNIQSIIEKSNRK